MPVGPAGTHEAIEMAPWGWGLPLLPGAHHSSAPRSGSNPCLPPNPQSILPSTVTRESACEHLSQVLPLCPQPSRAFTFLGHKPKFPQPTGLARPAPVPSLPSPPPSLPLTHAAPATQTPSLFLQHTRHSSAPGPLHLPCPLSGLLSPQLSPLPPSVLSLNITSLRSS